MQKTFQSKDILYEFAPAKINLALHILKKLDNGLHSLSSLVSFVDIGDEISMKIAQADRLEITGRFAKQLANESDNLILQALKIFRKKYPNALPFGVEFTLKKNLPLASGIGGGSSDAAAALRLLAKISNDEIAQNDLYEIAIKLGADVPVCLSARTCLMTGIGEKITPVEQFLNGYIVLVNPLINISTAEVFSLLKQIKNKPLKNIKEPFKNIEQLANWLQSTNNDLLNPAIEIVPIIKQITSSLKATNGCHFARMSGSGATIFALYSSQQQAQNAAQQMQNKYKNFWVKSGKII